MRTTKKDILQTRQKPLYNIRKYKEKKAIYRATIGTDLAEELYNQIFNIIIIEKKYKDPQYSAKYLAKLLKTNTSYLSAVISSRFGMNYPSLLNDCRIKEVLRLLTDRCYKDKKIGEIASIAGFTSRQSFYVAFYKHVGEPPNDYRKRFSDKKK
ncbi:AraC family transcriptional regulator [Bacteroides sp. 51]|uniref:helix-turn-helix domain-containing protein n=1 Tax=Bacteroides sp. 51 TaxID=2302938 RepID=UPI0013D75409|nr:helix-turn-helix domain-containing protein [Bacteroides sp. 51]NDV80868.1 AraC family transcriptional regulator [Bacteroides sp. 51]